MIIKLNFFSAENAIDTGVFQISFPIQSDNINIGVPLKSGEKIFCGEKSNLYEPRAVREFHGGSRGVSMRVAKGVSVRVGNFRGKSESHDELRVIDSGVLIATNKRLIFVGPNRNSISS